MKASEVIFVMYRVYRKVSETSDRVKETFVGTVDLKPDDIVSNDKQEQMFSGDFSDFYKITETIRIEAILSV